MHKRTPLCDYVSQLYALDDDSGWFLSSDSTHDLKSLSLSTYIPIGIYSKIWTDLDLEITELSDKSLVIIEKKKYQLFSEQWSLVPWLLLRWSELLWSSKTCSKTVWHHLTFWAS